jgi:hypothetical protein
MGTKTTLRTTWTRAAAAAAVLLAAAGAPAQESALRPPVRRFAVDVLVDGVPRPQYPARGTVYLEALRGREYTIRLANPLPVRVAVALSVDGLNTIDAEVTTPWKASKWVLDPYEVVEIPGWQVSGEAARRFVFTGERSSYGAWLGQTENLGVIEAVFFREQRGWGGIDPLMERRPTPGAAQKAPAPQAAAGAEALDDAYAATGMGSRQEHRVRRVHLRLERDPAAVVRLRYEFRPELERLGVLLPLRSPLERRENARGFPGYCPESPRW